MTLDWWARGLLFENCSCQLVCPGHVHFQQLCTHDRCVGFWAIRFDAGAFGNVSLERFLPIEIREDAATKRVSISGLLEGAIARIRGRDRTKPVTFENMFVQIHGPSQVLATGDGQFNDGRIVFSNRGTHGLSSTFEWRVSA